MAVGSGCCCGKRGCGSGRCGSYKSTSKGNRSGKPPCSTVTKDSCGCFVKEEAPFAVCVECKFCPYALPPGSNACDPAGLTRGSRVGEFPTVLLSEDMTLENFLATYQSMETLEVIMQGILLFITQDSSTISVSTFNKVISAFVASLKLGVRRKDLFCREARPSKEGQDSDDVAALAAILLNAFTTLPARNIIIRVGFGVVFGLFFLQIPPLVQALGDDATDVWIHYVMNVNLHAWASLPGDIGLDLQSFLTAFNEYLTTGTIDCAQCLVEYGIFEDFTAQIPMCVTGPMIDGIPRYFQLDLTFRLPAIKAWFKGSKADYLFSKIGTPEEIAHRINCVYASSSHRDVIGLLIAAVIDGFVLEEKEEDVE